MKLITEYTLASEAVLEEDTKDLYIKGVFMQSEVVNRNGRKYPVNVLEREVNNYLREYVSTNRAMGELNHPNSPKINPDRVSHLITEITKSGNDFIGKAKILNTPTGNIVRGLVEGGVQIGVSSRGLGSVREQNGINVVQEDFRLATVDVVTDPSAPTAFVNGIYESAEWIMGDGGEIIEKVIEDIKEEIETEAASTRKTSDIFMEMFNKYIDTMSK